MSEYLGFATVLAALSLLSPPVWIVLVAAWIPPSLLASRSLSLPGQGNDRAASLAARLAVANIALVLANACVGVLAALQPLSSVLFAIPGLALVVILATYGCGMYFVTHINGRPSDARLRRPLLVWAWASIPVTVALWAACVLLAFSRLGSFD